MFKLALKIKLDDTFESLATEFKDFSSLLPGWGLKALSIFVTIKIKIILLLLFIGGGIFYGLKIWQGTALGCPEPIIQEIVKNHHDGGILPYSAHLPIDGISSYPGPPPNLDMFSNFDFSQVYSNTPAAPSPTYSGPSYLPPNSPMQPGNSYLPPDNSYAPPSDSYGSPPPSASDTSGQPSPGYPYNNRRQSSTGRQISDESVSIFGDLVFRFLGVNTDQCRKRFVCELEFRNPFMRYAVKYMGQV